MATLKQSTTTNLSTNSIRDSIGNVKMLPDDLAQYGWYTRRTYTQVDSTSYNSFPAGRRVWGAANPFPEVTGFRAGSQLLMTFNVPSRHSSESWGGMYVEPQIRMNGGPWYSLGGTGYDLMYLTSQAISTYSQTLLIDPDMPDDFAVQFRFMFSQYDGTNWVNTSHAINSVSGTAPLMGGNNSDQHYFSIIVEELTRYNG